MTDRPATAPPTNWAYLADMQKWIDNPNTWLYGRWNQPARAAEGGVDLNSPAGTPVYALEAGRVVAQGTNNVDGNGVITTRVNVPGYGPEDLYYQHINKSPSIQTGQMVAYGQYIGTVADTTNMGWTPHVELGFNSDWGGPWGSNHPAPWVTDPRPLLKALILQHPNAATDSGTPPPSSNAHCPDYVSNAPLIGLPLCAIYEALVSFGEHIAVFILALLLMLIGLQLLRDKPVSDLVTKPAGIITKAAMP